MFPIVSPLVCLSVLAILSAAAALSPYLSPHLFCLIGVLFAAATLSPDLSPCFSDFIWLLNEFLSQVLLFFELLSRVYARVIL